MAAVNEVTDRLTKSKREGLNTHVEASPCRQRHSASPNSAGAPEAEDRLIACQFAQIKDLQLCLERPKRFVSPGRHGEGVQLLKEAVQEALRRAKGNPEVHIWEITDAKLWLIDGKSFL